MWPWRSWVQVPSPTPIAVRCLGRIWLRQAFWGVAKRLRHETLTLAFAGSIPAAPARYDPLAQSVEHLTFNQRVPRSSRGWVTIFFVRAWRNGRRARFRIWCREAYEFESLRPHHTMFFAVVAQLVERRLAKAKVASPSLVYRSKKRGCNSMAEFQPSKLATWVRFPSPAPRVIFAVVAQLVERRLAKAKVASPSLVYRSTCTISSVGRAPDS